MLSPAKRDDRGPLYRSRAGRLQPIVSEDLTYNFNRFSSSAHCLPLPTQSVLCRWISVGGPFQSINRCPRWRRHTLSLDGPIQRGLLSSLSLLSGNAMGMPSIPDTGTPLQLFSTFVCRTLTAAQPILCQPKRTGSTCRSSDTNGPSNQSTKQVR